MIKVIAFILAVLSMFNYIYLSKHYLFNLYYKNIDSDIIGGAILNSNLRYERLDYIILIKI